MHYHVMTLFPELIERTLSESIIGRALSSGLIALDTYNIRDYSSDKHRKTDDTPFGGGVGMVMTCQPVFSCLDAVRANIKEDSRTRVIYMSPKGRTLTHEVVRELSQYDELVFLCGHYEGVDQRIIDTLIDEEISIGDYVLTGGELPACIVIDAVSRLIDGVLAKPECYENESIASGILEYPQYTKPRDFMGMTVPEVLFSGDHAKIDRWRLERAVELTRERRPELLARHPEYEEALKPKSKRKSRSCGDKQ
ncbi:MAG: tRNA (guanosine(37)-N1)-methyltransferase TrmD [Clostridia bacterium]|nr:tRNA (guanosine(37)-N1)-methyltransferase TrmD [Clostridia bacterium]